MRDKARRANCLSNLKMIGLSIAMYADEYQGRCPMDSANPTLLGSMQLLSNILTSSDLLHCGNDLRPSVREETDWRKVTLSNISYSYVPNLIWQSTPDSALAADRIYSTSAGSSWPSGGNHKGQGGNILFNDGHVAWNNRLPSALKDKNGRETVLSP
jgi:prepilin-type processing-associated H-X9-DG protein